MVMNIRFNASVTVRQRGGTRYITLPKEAVKALDLRGGDACEISIIKRDDLGAEYLDEVKK